MAKVFVILLTLIYSFSATGATVYLHYCCGEPKKLVIQNEPEQSAPEDCSLCLTHHEKEKKDTTCCVEDDDCEASHPGHGHCQNVKVEAKKTTEEHLSRADKKLAKIYPLELLVFTLTYVIDLPLDMHHAVQTIDDAPPNVAVPLFIQHCTYRI